MRGLVIQPGSKPSFGFLQGHAFADVIIKQLIATEPANGEVFRFRVRKIKSAHAAGGPHRKTFRQIDAGVLLRVEQFPENSLFRVIGTGGIARRRPNAAILFRDQIFGGQLFRFAVAPLLADAPVQKFRERLRQPVGQRFRHDGVVVVVVGLEFFYQLINAVAGGDGKGAQMVGGRTCFRHLAGSSI